LSKGWIIVDGKQEREYKNSIVNIFAASIDKKCSPEGHWRAQNEIFLQQFLYE